MSVVEAGVVAGGLLEATVSEEGGVTIMGGGRLGLVGFEGEEEEVGDGGFATGHYVSFSFSFLVEYLIVRLFIATTFIVSSKALSLSISLVDSNFFSVRLLFHPVSFMVVSIPTLFNPASSSIVHCFYRETW